MVIAAHQTSTTDLALPGLLGSWEIHLRAENKSGQTIKIYSDGVRAFLRWAACNGVQAELDRPTVSWVTADLLDAGALFLGDRGEGLGYYGLKRTRPKR